eukprot:COSAG03_NODE_25614_length_264_cov_0.939394_1_plen_75_part_10
MDDDDAATLAVIAEMDLDDARDVCVEEGVPFEEGEALHVLQGKLRSHMCPRALEPEPEPEPEPERPPLAPQRPVP